VAPPYGWFKANWDAAVGAKSDCVGLGVIIRDHCGNMVAAKSLTRRGLLEPAAAEALAALMAIQLARALGLRNLYLEGDAKIVIDAVLSSEPDWSRKGILVEDIRWNFKAYHVGK
jgi:ribonuclease HI